MCTRRSAPTLAVRGSRSAPRKPTRTPWRHLYADPRTGPLRSRRSSHRPQEGCAPRGLGRSSRALRLRSTEASTTPGGRLDQSSKPPPHYTGDCSLIDSPECLTTVDRFRCAMSSGATSTSPPAVGVGRPLRTPCSGPLLRRSAACTTERTGGGAAYPRPPGPEQLPRFAYPPRLVGRFHSLPFSLGVPASSISLPSPYSNSLLVPCLT